MTITNDPQKLKDGMFRLGCFLLGLPLAFVAMYLEENISPFGIIIISIIGVILLTALILLGIRYNRVISGKVKNQRTRTTSRDDRILDELLADTDELIEESRRSRTGRERISSNPSTEEIPVNKEKDWIHVRYYNGLVWGQKCAICKLELREDQKIVQCMNCKTLFHEKHLRQWLKNNTKCPVCERIIMF